MQAQKDAMEKQRVDYEKRVTELDTTVKNLERAGIEMRAKISELETALAR